MGMKSKENIFRELNNPWVLVLAIQIGKFADFFQSNKHLNFKVLRWGRYQGNHIIFKHITDNL